MKVGDLYWVEFPARGGHAQSGRRPAIVVQKPSNLPTVLVIPITSQQDALRFPGTALIESSKENDCATTPLRWSFNLRQLTDATSLTVSAELRKK